MNDLLAWPLVLLPVFAVAVVVLHALARRLRRRRQALREHGWRLVHELKAYSAWVDSLRGEPFLSTEPEELTPAEALRQARAIAQAHFPQLSGAMLRLLRADSRLMRHLWHQKLLRLSEPGAWVPYRRDPEYRQLRDSQEDLIEEIIARCQVLIGDRDQPWRSTDLDSEFFAAAGVNTRPCR